MVSEIPLGFFRDSSERFLAERFLAERFLAESLPDSLQIHDISLRTEIFTGYSV